MDRCRKKQGWTTACSGMPERDGKGKVEDSPKASGLVLVRSPLLTSHKWCELGPSGRLVCRCHDVFLWCYVCFVLLCFASFFVFMLSSKPRPFVQSSFDMQAPRLPHVLLFFWRWCFFRVFLHHFRFLLVWTIEYVVRTFFLPNGVFLPCDHELDF